MDLDEYLWRKKKTLTDLANDIGCARETLSVYKQRKSTPNLFLALKIYYASGKEISLEKLLSTKNEEEFKKWLAH